MAVNYDKLWVILKEREMLKTDLRYSDEKTFDHRLRAFWR